MIKRKKQRLKYKVQEIKLFDFFHLNKLPIIVASLLFILFFFFINNKRMSEEYSIVNVWIKEAGQYGEPYSDPIVKIEGQFLLDFFTLNGQFIHYFDNNGFSLSYKSLANNEIASVNKDNYIVYKRFGLDMSAFDKFGRSLWKTNTSSYPEVASYANVISLHSSENSSFTLIDWNHNMLTDGSKRYGEYITDSAFSKETGDYVVGYINGNIIMYYRTGKLGFQVIPIISEINVSKAVSITERGSFIASVTGIKNEYLSVYNATGNLIWHINTMGDARKNVYLGISEFSMSVSMLHEEEKKINIYNLANGALKGYIDLEKYNLGDIKYMKFDSSKNVVFFSVSSIDKSILILYDIKNNQILWQKMFDEQIYNISISTKDNEYLIITKNYIYAFKRIKI